MTDDARVSGATIVLGLGNPVRYDDAVGLRVAEAVERLLGAEPLPGVSVATSTRAGLELIDLLAGASRAIIVDCLSVPAPVPGRISRLTLDDVAGSARLVGAHDVTIETAFRFARAAGVPMPDHVDIFAVEAADVDRLEEGLSPAVAAAVPELAREIYKRLPAPAVCPCAAGTGRA
jgi:hydrogenase maturation protease